MRNQNGVTLISLGVTIIILIVLASITVITSVQSYKEMRFQTFKSQLEEIQIKVDEICEDYKIFKKEVGADTTYSEYFLAKFNSVPTLFDKSDTTKVADLLTEHDEFIDHTGFVFYFNQDEVNKYLGLKGIDKEILVDFSTRYVYSVNGCKDPDSENGEIYYTAIDFDNNKVIITNQDDMKSNLGVLDVTSTPKQIGTTTMLQIDLTWTTNDSGTSYPITKVYYNKEDEGTDVWIEVTDFKYENEKISFILYEAGVYKFKIEDTSGAVIETANTASLSY